MLREHRIPWSEGNSSGTSRRYYPTRGISHLRLKLRSRGIGMKRGKESWVEQLDA